MKRIQSYITLFILSSPKNASLGRYEPIHFRSFQKSTKKAFFVKENYIKIKSTNAKMIKRDIVEDILSFPKSPISPSKDEN